MGVLQEGNLEGKVDSEIPGQVIGVQTKMQSFDFLFRIQLGVLVLMHTEKLFSALKYTSCYKAQ